MSDLSEKNAQALKTLVGYMQFEAKHNRFPVDTPEYAVWVNKSSDLRFAEDQAQVWDGYRWLPISEATLKVWADRERVDLPLVEGDVVDPGGESKALATIPQQSIAIPERSNPAEVLIASKPSANSRRTMRRGLDVIAEMITAGKYKSIPTTLFEGEQKVFYPGLDWSTVNYETARMIQAQLTERYKPASVNVMLSALRGVLKECWRLGYITAEELQRRIDGVNNLTVNTLPAGRDIDQGEFFALLRVCYLDTKNDQRTNASLRDAAIITILFNCGLRRSEVVGLTLADYDPQKNVLKVRKAKRNKERFVPIGKAKDHLILWLAQRGDQAGALFCAVNKGDNIQSEKHMSAQAIYNMLVKRGTEAGLVDSEGKITFSPHDFRRTVVGDMLSEGTDTVMVQKLMGHENINTTSRYDRRPVDDLIQTMEKRYIPKPGAML